MQHNTPPPKALVDTWLSLIRSDKSDQQVKMRAMEMLRNCIGSPQEIEAYLKQHHIR